MSMADLIQWVRTAQRTGVLTLSGGVAAALHAGPAIVLSMVVAGIVVALGVAMLAEALFLSRRAIEKHINSIFSKLGLSEEKVLSRRVAAVPAALVAGMSAAGRSAVSAARSNPVA